MKAEERGEELRGDKSRGEEDMRAGERGEETAGEMRGEGRLN